MRGVSPSSRHVGRGMRWTRRSKGEWVCCVRSSRVVLAPRMLAKSSWEVRFLGATVTTSSLHREEHEVSRKAIAQGMSVCSPLPCMLVCANAQFLGTRDRGCSAHPAFPAPSLRREGQRDCKTRMQIASREYLRSSFRSARSASPESITTGRCWFKESR
jgi:hypothetical protein